MTRPKSLPGESGTPWDRYGRLLRYVHLDGENFNARLIREGLTLPPKTGPS